MVTAFSLLAKARTERFAHVNLLRGGRLYRSSHSRMVVATGGDGSVTGGALVPGAEGGYRADADTG